MAKREKPRNNAVKPGQPDVARESARETSNAAHKASVEVPRLKSIRDEFMRAHREGMAALRAGDYRKVGEAVDKEQDLIAEQRALIEQQQRDMDRLIRSIAKTLTGSATRTPRSRRNGER